MQVGRADHTVTEGKPFNPSRPGSRSHGITKSAQEPNGIKLASELWLEQLLTQFLPGCDHQWEALGAPLFDARLHPMGTYGVHDEGPSWNPGAWRAEPPQRLQKADPLYSEMWPCG